MKCSLTQQPRKEVNVEVGIFRLRLFFDVVHTVDMLDMDMRDCRYLLKIDGFYFCS